MRCVLPVVLALAVTGSALAGFRESAPEAQADASALLPFPLALSPLPESWALPRLNETSWLKGAVSTRRRFRLAPPDTLSWIGRYQRPWENHTPEWRTFFDGRYGLGSAPQPTLDWRLSESFEPLSLPITIGRPCPRWKAPRPLNVSRYSAETERLPLFDCDGAIAPDVLDRLSVLARAPETPRPELPLPDAPSATVPGEWLPGVRLLDPRLVWVLGELQEAFPSRTVVIMSGYRPHGHTSYHRRGKALDVYVQGVPNEQLFAVCRMLRDVACGYYPNNHFVHLDVRPFGSAKTAWVDVSEPGTASRYVDGWPGVLPARERTKAERARMSEDVAVSAP